MNVEQSSTTWKSRFNLLKVDLNNTSYSGCSFWTVISILVFVYGWSSPWGFYPHLLDRNYFSEHDQAVFALIRVIFTTSMFLISFFIFKGMVESKNELVWTRENSKSACADFVLLMLAGLLWQFRRALFANINTSIIGNHLGEYSFGTISLTVTICIQILNCYLQITWFRHLLFSTGCAIAIINRFATGKEEKKPENTQHAMPSLDDLATRLQRQVSLQHFKQFFLYFCMSLCLISGVAFFNVYSGNPVMADIRKAADTINKTKISRIMGNAQLDRLVANLKYEAEHGDISNSDVVAKLKAIDTISHKGEFPNYDIQLSEIADQSRLLNTKLNEYQPIDWQGVAIRIAFLSLLIFVLQMLFAANRQVAKEISRLQDHLTSTQIAIAKDNGSINDLADLYSRITGDISVDPTPSTLFEKGFEAAMRMTQKGNKGE